MRISTEAAVAFWDRVPELADYLTRTPRSGDQMIGFAAGLYALDHPTLPDREESTDD